MERIRLSGNKTYNAETIRCLRCGTLVIDDGEPMTPIYYTKTRLHGRLTFVDNFCSQKCADAISLR